MGEGGRQGEVVRAGLTGGWVVGGGLLGEGEVGRFAVGDYTGWGRGWGRSVSKKRHSS